MTRDEAIARVKHGEGWLVDSLVRLGLFHIETTEEKDRVAAAKQLENMFTIVVSDGGKCSRRIHLEGAYEIIDILTKSGFKITKEPT